MGHVRLAKIPSKPNAVWIESVVIHPDLRGKRFGKYLMLICEKFAKDKGFLEAYLCTIDRQIFYSRCGYTFCDPVCAYSGNIKLPSGLTSSKPMTGYEDQQGDTATSNLESRTSSNDSSVKNTKSSIWKKPGSDGDSSESIEKKINSCDTKSIYSNISNNTMINDDVADLSVMCAKLFCRPTFSPTPPEFLEKPLRSLAKNSQLNRVSKDDICRATIPKDYMKKKL